MARRVLLAVVVVVVSVLVAAIKKKEGKRKASSKLRERWIKKAVVAYGQLSYTGKKLLVEAAATATATTTLAVVAWRKEKAFKRRVFIQNSEPVDYAFICCSIKTNTFMIMNWGGGVVETRDTTIQQMTIRRMLIERHFWLHCWLSDFIK